MRVLHLANAYLPYTGGSAIRLQSVLKPLIDYPHIETHVLCMYPSSAEPIAANELLDNVHVHRFSSYLKLPSKIRSLHRRYQFDVIHAHNARVALISLLVTSCPMILEFHSIAHEKGAKAALTRLVCRRAKRVFTLASSASKQLRENARIPENKIETLYNGIDVDRFDPRLHDGKMVRDRYALGGGIVIGYAGTFWDWQGVDLLVKSFSTIAARFPTARLFLVGDKPELDTIRRLIESLRIKEQAVLAGHVPFAEITSHFACMDIFGIMRPATIMTDTAVPLKVLEAMSMEKCVVATPVGGILEVVEHGLTGWITDNHEPATIGDALAKLIIDGESRTRIGQAARESVLGRFTWKKTTAKMVLAYEEVAAESRQRRCTSVS